MAIKPSTNLRTLSLKLLAKKPAASSAATVVPWPTTLSLFYQWLAIELQDLSLRSQPNPATSWLSDALHLSASAQTKALRSIQSSPSPIDHRTIEVYLDDNDLFVAIEGVRQRIEAIRRQTARFSTAIRRLECGSAAVDRARAELSPLPDEGPEPEKFSWHAIDDEMLDGSRAVAGFVVATVWAALSSKMRRGVPAGMDELRAAMEAAARLRRLVKEGKRCPLEREEVKAAAEELRRRKVELEEGVGDLEEKVEELYQRLVAIRVFLLGVLSFER